LIKTPLVHIVRSLT